MWEIQRVSNYAPSYCIFVFPFLKNVHYFLLLPDLEKKVETLISLATVRLA